MGFVGIHAGDFRDGGDWDDPAELVWAGDAWDVVLALEDEGLLGLVMDDEGALIGDGSVDLFRIHLAIGEERGGGVEDEGEDENPEGEAGFHGRGDDGKRGAKAFKVHEGREGDLEMEMRVFGFGEGDVFPAKF